MTWDIYWGLAFGFMLSSVVRSFVPTKTIASRLGKNSAAAVGLQEGAGQKQMIANQGQQLEEQRKQLAELSQQIIHLNEKILQLQADATNKQSLLSKSKQELINQQVKLEYLQALMDKQKKAIEEIRKKMTDALVGFKSNELSAEAG